MLANFRFIHALVQKMAITLDDAQTAPPESSGSHRDSLLIVSMAECAVAHRAPRGDSLSERPTYLIERFPYFPGSRDSLLRWSGQTGFRKLLSYRRSALLLRMVLRLPGRSNEPSFD